MTNAIIGCRLGLSSVDPELFCAAPMPNQEGRLPIHGHLATQKGLRSGWPARLPEHWKRGL